MTPPKALPRKELFIFACFFVGVVVASAAFGMASVKFEIFPYSLIKKAYRSLTSLRAIEISDFPIGFEKTVKAPDFQKPGDRFKTYPGYKGREFLVAGGPFQFLDVCPEYGCLAVVFGKDFEVIKKYPFYPDKLFGGPLIIDKKGYYYGGGMEMDYGVIGVQMYKNGDIQISMQRRNDYPYSGGLARVTEQGEVLWRRNDYSHHWQKLLPNGITIAPMHDIRDGKEGRKKSVLGCNEPQLDDKLVYVDGNGKSVGEISILESFLASEKYKLLFSYVPNPCDPLHVNFVDVASKAVADKISWINEGDLLISARNISVVAFIDPKDGTLKNVIRGSFIGQHSAQFYGNDKILIFDDLGSSKESFPSRILSVDLVSGKEEVLFASKEKLRKDFFSAAGGHFNVTPDGKFALVSFSRAGKMYEIDLSKGEVTMEYTSLHRIPGTKTDLAKSSNDDVAVFGTLGGWYMENLVDIK